MYYNRSGCGQCIHTVHAYGLHGGAPHGTYNHGTRIVDGFQLLPLGDALFQHVIAARRERTAGRKLPPPKQAAQRPRA